MMKGTALGAENREMNFMNNAHEKFYYEKLKEVRYVVVKLFCNTCG